MRPDKPCVHGVAVAAPCYDCCLEHNTDLLAEVERLRLDLSTAKADARRAALEEAFRVLEQRKRWGEANIVLALLDTPARVSRMDTPATPEQRDANDEREQQRALKDDR